MQCLEEQLRAGAGILCPRLHPGDLASAYVYANNIGSSFVRDFPLPTVRLGQAGLEPLFRLSTAAPETWHTQSMTVVSAGSNSLLLEPTGENAALTIRPRAGEAMRACVHLQAALTTSAARPDAMRLFFGEAKMARFADEIEPSQSTTAGNIGLQELYFHVDSPEGFDPDIEIRPDAQEREFRIGEIELICLLRKR